VKLPHTPDVWYPGLKRTIKKRSVSGESFSETAASNSGQEYESFNRHFFWF
jgi:hypothetical protein